MDIEIVLETIENKITDQFNPANLLNYPLYFYLIDDVLDLFNFYHIHHANLISDELEVPPYSSFDEFINIMLLIDSSCL